MLAGRLARRLSRLGLHYSWVVLAVVFALSVVKDGLAASSGAGGFGGAQAQAQSSGGMPGAMMASPMQQQQQQPMGGMMGGFGQMGGYNQMPGFQGQMGSMGGMNPPNVQPIQFASLQMQQASPESGNIGLIMDVFMEMTSTSVDYRAHTVDEAAAHDAVPVR